jgi:hypothetical protein
MTPLKSAYSGQQRGTGDLRIEAFLQIGQEEPVGKQQRGGAEN